MSIAWGCEMTTAKTLPHPVNIEAEQSVLGAILVAVATAALVAWRPVRVRPLEVLRYE